MNEFADNIVDMKFKNWAVYVFHKKKYSGLIKKKKSANRQWKVLRTLTIYIFSSPNGIFSMCERRNQTKNSINSIIERFWFASMEIS